MYPAPLCRAYALILVDALRAAGAQPAPEALSALADAHLQARVATGVQPRGKRAPPLLPEHKAICVLQGLARALPVGPVLQQPWLPTHDVRCQPPYPLLPAKSRVLCALPCQGNQEGGCMTEQQSDPPSLAADALNKGDLSSDMCAQVLAHSFITPLEARRPGVLEKGQRANYFVLGAYKCLPRKGITKLTNDHLNTAAFVNAFLQQRFPGASWSAFVVTHNEASSLHVDSCNVPGTKNFAIGLGNYSGGELFVEAEGGSFPFEDPCTGEWLWGEVLALNLGACSFDGRARHATLPWVGDRWTIIAYSAVVQGDLSPDQEQVLRSSGFPLPWVSPFASAPLAPNDLTQVRMSIGVPWDPCDFVREAAKRGHPRHLFDGIPPVLKSAIDAV